MRPTFTNEHRYELLTGNDSFGLGFGSDEAGRKAAWLEHREELLAAWLAGRVHYHADRDGKVPGHGGPGTRPWGWWRYDAPEPRRRLGGTGTAALEDPNCPAWAAEKGNWFGTPGVYGSDYDADDPPRFETQLAYLKRLKLLTAEERAQLNGR